MRSFGETISDIEKQTVLVKQLSEDVKYGLATKLELAEAISKLQEMTKPGTELGSFGTFDYNYLLILMILIGVGGAIYLFYKRWK